MTTLMAVEADGRFDAAAASNDGGLEIHPRLRLDAAYHDFDGRDISDPRRLPGREHQRTTAQPEPWHWKRERAVRTIRSHADSPHLETVRVRWVDQPIATHRKEIDGDRSTGNRPELKAAGNLIADGPTYGTTGAA